MGEGSVFVRADGRVCAKYLDSHGKTRYLYGKTRQEVRRKLRQALQDRDAGIIPAHKINVGMLLDEWLEDIQSTITRQTFLNHEGIVRNHLKPTLGSKKLSALTPRDIERLYKDKLNSGMSHGRVRKVHVTLNRALKDAVRWQYMPRNPAADVNPPRDKQRQPKEVLTPEQVRSLLTAAHGDRLEPVYVLGATVGLRIGECLALRFEDVDLEAGTLKVRRTLWRNQVNPPKTPRSNRKLRLPRIAIDSLRRHMPQCQQQEG